MQYFLEHHLNICNIPLSYNLTTHTHIVLSIWWFIFGGVCLPPCLSYAYLFRFLLSQCHFSAFIIFISSSIWCLLKFSAIMGVYLRLHQVGNPRDSSIHKHIDFPSFSFSTRNKKKNVPRLSRKWGDNAYYYCVSYLFDISLYVKLSLLNSILGLQAQST